MFLVPLAISDNYPTYHQECVGENISKKKLLHATLRITFGNFNYSLSENTSNILTQTLLFGSMSLSPSDNSQTLIATNDFILATNRFEEQFF